MICAGCGTKFNCFHSYNDPQKVRFFDLSKFNGKKQRATGFFLVLMLILIILWMVLYWMNSH